MVLNMKREELLPCEGKKAKLVLENDYVLRGIVTKVYDDNIFFSTPEKKAFIRIDIIKEIVFS